MSEIFKAIIYGPAGVQGSKCSFPHPVTGKMVMIEASKGEGKGRSWRQELIQSALIDQPKEMFDEAMFVWLRVYVSRPTSHYNKSGLKPSAPKYPKSGRDLDKVERSVADGLAIAKWFVNDSRIAGWSVLRLYTKDILDPERVEVMMWSLEQHGPDFLNKIMERITITDGHPISERDYDMLTNSKESS